MISFVFFFPRTQDWHLYISIILSERKNYRTYEIWCYTQKIKEEIMKKKILLRTLMPLATVGAALGTALPLVSCSCGNNDNEGIQI
jgi:hypothetical protein